MIVGPGGSGGGCTTRLRRRIRLAESSGTQGCRLSLPLMWSTVVLARFRCYAGRRTWTTIVTAGPNTSSSTRMATLAVAGTSVSIAQDNSASSGGNCAVSIAPTALRLSSAGGGGNLAVSAAPTCSWRITGLDPWISVSPLSGVGPTSLVYSAGATSVARLGRIVLSNQDIAILMQTKPTPGGIHTEMMSDCEEFDGINVCWGDDGGGGVADGVGQGACRGHGDNGHAYQLTEVTALMPSPDPEPPSTSWCGDIAGSRCRCVAADPSGADPNDAQDKYA